MSDRDIVLMQQDAAGKYVERTLSPAANKIISFDASGLPVCVTPTLPTVYTTIINIGAWTYVNQNVSPCDFLGANATVFLNIVTNDVVTPSPGAITTLSLTLDRFTEPSGDFYATMLPNLQYFSSSSDAFNHIYLDNLTKLIVINLRQSNLYNIHAPGCTSLGSIAFNQNSNNLNGIYVSGCTSLLTLVPQGNNISLIDVTGCLGMTTLDVSSCGTYTDIIGIDSLVNLEYFIGYFGNNIINILVFNSNVLEFISLPFYGSLYSLTVHSPVLSTCILTGNYLTYIDVSGCSALNLNTNELGSGIYYLDISGTATDILSFSGANSVVLKCEDCTLLTTLNVWMSSFTSLNISGCSQLLSIDISVQTGLSTIDLTGCTSIKKIEAYSSSISELDVLGRTTLEYLDLHGCVSLASLYITGCSGLSYIDLSGCVISDSNNIDAIFNEANPLLTGGTINVSGVNMAAVTAASAAARAVLSNPAGANWTLTYNS